MLSEMLFFLKLLFKKKGENVFTNSLFLFPHKKKEEISPQSSTMVKKEKEPKKEPKKEASKKKEGKRQQKGGGGAKNKKKVGEVKETTKLKKPTYLRDARRLTILQKRTKTIIPKAKYKRMAYAAAQYKGVVSQASDAIDYSKEAIIFSDEAIEVLALCTEMDVARALAVAADSIPNAKNKRKTLMGCDVQVAWNQDLRNDITSFDPHEIQDIQPIPEALPQRVTRGRKTKSANVADHPGALAMKSRV